MTAARTGRRAQLDGWTNPLRDARDKRLPRIAGPCGLVIFGVTGYTVETVEGAAFRIRHLLGNPELIGRMGAAGREHIRRNFLITRHLGDYLALLALLTK